MSKLAETFNHSFDPCVAIFFLLATGCRPKEAAIIVQTKSIEKANYHYPHQEHTFKATAPSDDVKTRRNYFWLLPMRTDAVVKQLRELTDTGYGKHETLTATLNKFWDRQILAKVNVPQTDPHGHRYSMRTVRAYRATEYIRLRAEYRVMQWKPEPPNPLQHLSTKTTLTYYAAQGSDSEWEARRRCVEKYGRDPEKRQEWMEQWQPEEEYGY